MGHLWKVFDASSSLFDTTFTLLTFASIPLSPPFSHPTLTHDEKQLHTYIHTYIHTCIHTFPYQATDLEGQTALHVAARSGHLQLTRQLSSHQVGKQLRQIKDKNGHLYVELLPPEKILSFLLIELEGLDGDGMLVKVQEDDYLLWFMVLRESPSEGSDDILAYPFNLFDT